MIEPIKRFRIGKSLLLSISQLQMQFGISPLETHKPRLKMSPSRSKDDIRRRVRTHDPLLLLPTSPAANGSSSLWMYRAPQVFRYTGRQSFGEVYTLCFKGGSTNGGAQARWRRDGKEFVLHCARWPAHGRMGTFLCILVQCHLMLTEWLVKASVTA